MENATVFSRRIRVSFSVRLLYGPVRQIDETAPIFFDYRGAERKSLGKVTKAICVCSGRRWRGGDVFKNKIFTWQILFIGFHGLLLLFFHINFPE